MQSIFTPYLRPSDVEASPLFDKLKAKGLDYMSSIDFEAYKYRVHDELRDLLGYDLHRDFFIMLITPWMNTLQSMGMVNKVSAFNETQQYIKDILKHGEQLRKVLKRWADNSQTIGLYALMEGMEPNFDNLIFNLGELEQLALFCSKQLEFARGKKHSQGEIKRYGVFALFHLGENLGLTNDTKPSKLYAFVRILTELSEQDIYDYYAEYKSTTIEKEIVDNPIYEYIYCPRTLVKNIQYKMPLIRRCPYNGLVAPIVFTLTPSIFQGVNDVRYG